MKLPTARKLAPIALIAIMATPSIAGNLAAPMIEPEVIAQDTATTSSGGGLLIPIFLLLLLAAAASSGGNGTPPPMT